MGRGSLFPLQLRVVIQSGKSESPKILNNWDLVPCSFRSLFKPQIHLRHFLLLPLPSLFSSSSKKIKKPSEAEEEEEEEVAMALMEWMPFFLALCELGLLTALALKASNAQSLEPAMPPNPSSDGVAIDQGIAYVLMLAALVLTYIIH